MGRIFHLLFWEPFITVSYQSYNIGPMFEAKAPLGVNVEFLNNLLETQTCAFKGRCYDLRMYKGRPVPKGLP